jgi:hypothetical protein
MISESDLDLFQYADDPETAMGLLREGLTQLYLQPAVPLSPGEHETPAIAQSRV